jgi:hypothetical protein
MSDNLFDKIENATVIIYDNSTYIFINMEAIEALNALIADRKAAYSTLTGSFQIFTSPTIICKDGTIDPSQDDSFNNGIQQKSVK